MIRMIIVEEEDVAVNKLDKYIEENCERVKNATYTGRTIIMGISPDGKSIIQMYWTVGRSENSKNRQIVRCQNGIRTEPIYDDAEMQYKELLIYNISREIENVHIISNGSQTDHIYEYLKQGKSFYDAMNEISFEHDAPIYTPRISGVMQFSNSGIELEFGIAKTFYGNPNTTLRNVYKIDNPFPGTGYCIHTYDFGDNCESFAGEPYCVMSFNDIDSMAQYYWDILKPNKRVGLYVKYINLSDGTIEDRIINEKGEAENEY